MQNRRVTIVTIRPYADAVNRTRMSKLLVLHSGLNPAFQLRAIYPNSSLGYNSRPAGYHSPVTSAIAVDGIAPGTPVYRTGILLLKLHDHRHSPELNRRLLCCRQASYHLTTVPTPTVRIELTLYWLTASCFHH